MPSEDDVFETRNKRYQVLNTIYDLAKQGKVIISSSDITSNTNIERKELHDILKFLLDEGWISERSSIKNLIMPHGNAGVSITNTGLLHVESTKNPN